MKKIYCILAVCAIFTACEGKKAPESSVPTLTWWFYGSTPSNLRDGLKAINEYIEPKIGARLDIKIAGWAEASQRMRTIVNSGEYFDIMFIDLGDYNNFVRLGAYADLTDMLTADAPALKSAIPDMLWDGVRINGKIYAVPTYKDSSKPVFSCGMISMCRNTASTSQKCIASRNWTPLCGRSNRAKAAGFTPSR
jgi:ABC-type glycerol-3-phosphate transport system substrate-binding protein